MLNPMTAAMAFSGESELDNLIKRVKDLQRTAPEAKEQWIAYTDANAFGRRDPSKHPAPFLAGFLAQYEGGTRMTLHEDAVHVGDLITMMTKKSKNFKNQWAAFCQEHGHPVSESNEDPASHEPAFHVKFLDTVAIQANMVTPPHAGMGMTGSSLAHDMPAAKRPRIDGGMGIPGMAMPGMGSGDPVKDRLVNQIKCFQRLGDDRRDMWRTYCEANLSSILDPNRHEVGVLQQFVTSYHVPEADASMLSSLPFNNLMPAMGASLDPEKDALVAKIKTFQRNGPEQKDAWYSFCGNKRDPARHETASLQDFCNTYGVV